MFKIGDFSKLTQISVRMLRYYDEMGLLKPAQIDPFTGYRMYSAGQIPTVQRILLLRDMGCGANEMAQALEDWSQPRLEAILSQRADAIQQEQRRLASQLDNIHISLSHWGKQDGREPMALSIKPVPSYRVLSLRRTIPDYYAESVLWKEIEAWVGENSLPISGTLSIYHDHEYKESDVDVEICALLEEDFPEQDFGGGFACRRTKAQPFMAYTMVLGSFENIGPAYLGFAAWLAQHSGYQMEGSSRQIVHRGPWNEAAPEQYLTEIQIPLLPSTKAAEE